MNILIVDDEYYIVQGIMNTCNWAKLGIQEIYSAYSVDQAIKIISDKKVDILLTDIQMPKKSGLDLISWVNDNGYNPVKLLLTGHENFDYARKALRLGCLQYIVKPAKTDELELALKEAIGVLQKERLRTQAVKQASSWNTNDRIRYDHMFIELLKSKETMDDSYIKNTLDRYGLPSHWVNMEFHTLHLSLSGSSLESKDFINPITKQYSVVILDFFYQIRENEFLLLIPLEMSSLLAMREFMTDLLEDQVKTCPDFGFTGFISSPINLSQLGNFYAESSDYIERTFSVSNLLIDLNRNKVHNLIQPVDLNLLHTEKWSDYILNNASHRILEEIQALYLRKTKLYEKKDLASIYHNILHSVLSILKNNDIDTLDFINDLQEKDKIETSTSSLRHLLEWSRLVFDQLKSLLFNTSESHQFLISVKEVIKKNLSSPDLNRNLIANQVHMNPDYLSHLFNKLSGQHLSAYINNERINLAKNLLLTSQTSLQSIADETGFSTQSYFHKQFKKATGMTPYQFRKSNI